MVARGRRARLEAQLGFDRPGQPLTFLKTHIGALPTVRHGENSLSRGGGTGMKMVVRGQCFPGREALQEINCRGRPLTSIKTYGQAVPTVCAATFCSADGGRSERPPAALQNGRPPARSSLLHGRSQIRPRRPTAGTDSPPRAPSGSPRHSSAGPVCAAGATSPSGILWRCHPSASGSIGPPSPA